MNARITIDGGASGGRARLHGVGLGAPATATLDEPLSLTTTSPAALVERIERLIGALPAHRGVVSVSVGLAGGMARGSTQVRDGVQALVPTADVVVGRDVDLVLAHLRGAGAAVIVGTGAVIAVAAGDGAEVLIDGRGFAMGDRGGGAWIGLEALRTGLRALDLTGERLPLLDALLDVLGMTSDRGVAAALSEGGAISPRRVAALAPVVITRADDGDADATRIVDRAAQALAEGLASGLRRAGVDDPTDVVAAGGLIGIPGFRARLQAVVATRGASAHLRVVDPLDTKLVGARTSTAEGR